MVTIGSFFLCFVGLVVGWRRGRIDSKAVGAILAYGLFMTAVVGVANLSMKPWMGQPGPLLWGLALVSYVAPLMLGYAVGAAAKRQRLANDEEANGAA